MLLIQEGEMATPLEKAAEKIRSSKYTIALTGAGISVESGIPDFRSAEGLWSKYDPAVYANIDVFEKYPEKVWEMLFEMVELTGSAKPNKGHIALAHLEKMGYLKGIITQNIDNLHQDAGSSVVVEYHGNARYLECPTCGKVSPVGDFDLSGRVVPRCSICRVILKPAVIFFGEAIPVDAMRESNVMASRADVVLVVGTSAVVYPAAAIPMTAKGTGATIVEFNIERTELTSRGTDIFVEGSAGITLPELVRLLEKG